MANVLTVTKTIRTSGSSLSLYMTKELKILGLNKGDAVEVTIKRIKEE